MLASLSKVLFAPKQTEVPLVSSAELMMKTGRRKEFLKLMLLALALC